MLIHSDVQSVGSTLLWRVQYGRWLSNTAYITACTAVSDNANFTVGTLQILGKDVVVPVTAGASALNAVATITVTMHDSLGNILVDTIQLTGVSP